METFKSGELDSNAELLPIEQPSMDDRSGISRLPEHILTLIFKSIPISQWPSLEIVSRQFQGSVKMAWRDIREIRLTDFRFYRKLMLQNRSLFMAEVLEKIGTRAPNITAINGFSAIVPRIFSTERCRENENISTLAIQKLAVFKCLETVNFANSQLYPTELIEFLRSTNRDVLKHMDITNCYLADWRHEHLPTVAFSQIDSLPALKLETLVVEGNFMFIYQETLSLPCLTTFKGTGTINKDGLFATFLSQSPHLKHLEFSFIILDMDPSRQAVFDAIIALEHLSILKISFSYHRAPLPQLQALLMSLIASLGQRRVLTSFGLDNWHHFHNEIALTIGQHLINLTSLELPVFTGQRTPIRYLLGNLIHLENLCFKYRKLSALVMNATIAALVGNQGALKSLRFEDMPLEPRPVTANPAPVQAPPAEPEAIKFEDVSQLANLKELHIQDARLMNSALESWADSMGPNLEVLELIGCKKLTSIGFVPIIQHMPQVRRLVIKDTNIKDAVLTVIAAYSSNLEYLELSLVNCTTTACIQSVIDRCKFLKLFKITSDCWVLQKQLDIPK